MALYLPAIHILIAMYQLSPWMGKCNNDPVQQHRTMQESGVRETYV